MTVEETLRIALEAHEGQKDLDGKPVVLHPIAVGLMGCNDAETKTGFLHDAVEDSELTLDELRGRGVDEDVLAALQLLTHARTEDYFDYVRRIAASGNTTAIHVKMNDLRHNLERGADLCAGCGGRRHGKGGASGPRQQQAPQGPADIREPRTAMICML